MKVEKVCNFYASKYHLSIILLEYLKNKKIKKSKVITFLQNEIEDEINVLREKYKYDEDIINDIDFTITKDIYGKEINPSKNVIFIVEGNLNYMKEANDYILNTLERGTNATVINCHNFNHQKSYMREIIAKNNKILYTTGEKIID